MTPTGRALRRRFLGLVETLILIAAGFALYFWKTPAPAPIDKIIAAAPAASEAPDDAPPSPPAAISAPAALKEQYEFDGGEVFFDDAIEPATIALIERATASIGAVTYTMDDSPVVAALEAAAARGVTVSVIAGRRKSERRPAFTMVDFHPVKGILHEKFFVVDRRTALISSRNLSSGWSKNAAILFHNAPKLSALLLEEIDSLEQMRVEPRCPTGCPVEEGRLYFLPGKGCRAVKETLLSAKERIDAALYTVTIGTPLMTGLKKALKSGRSVDLLIDDWSGDDGTTVNRRAGRYLEGLGAQVWFDRLKDPQGKEMNFHHKFAVVDGDAALVFGSMNWTKAACYRNREVLFITKNQEISGIFGTYFQEMRAAIAPEKRGQAH